MDEECGPNQTTREVSSDPGLQKLTIKMIQRDIWYFFENSKSKLRFKFAKSFHPEIL